MLVLCQVVEIVDGDMVSGWYQMCPYIYRCKEDLVAEYLLVIVILNNDGQRIVHKVNYNSTESSDINV